MFFLLGMGVGKADLAGGGAQVLGRQGCKDVKGNICFAF
jgi:hypothetical protein